MVALALVTLVWPVGSADAVEPADPGVPADAVSWADRSGVRAVTEALATNPQYGDTYLSWTGITIGSLCTELAVTLSSSQAPGRHPETSYRWLSTSRRSSTRGS